MLRATSLRSRVAQRIFSVFLLCALLPFAGLVLIAYHQVVAFFEIKNQSQLRDLAKLFGSEVHERLTLLESTLQVIALTIKVTGAMPDEMILGSLWRNYTEQWEALSLVTNHGEVARLSGKLDFFQEFTPTEIKHLAAAKALISVRQESRNGPVRILLSIRLNPKQPESDLLVGEIKASYLWGLKDSRIMPAHIEPCVQDINGVTLMCSLTAPTGLLKTLIGKPAIGDIEWTRAGRQFMASYWTVPMKYEFQVPGWVVLLATSREGAFASISELQRSFILTIIASVGLSMLLAIFQIRKRLVPVEKLQEGTRRIAENDFAFKIETQTNDEFDELAASMNTMAERLGRQFKTITTTGEIDRAVLSLLDTAKIVETILSRISAALRCEMGDLTFFNDETGQAQHWQLQWQPNFSNYTLSSKSWPRETTKDENPLAYAVSETKTVITASDPQTFYMAGESAIPRGELSACLGAPLMVKENVLGVLSFYARDKRKFTTEEIEFVGRLTNQAAVALYNSQLYERTIKQATALLKANQAKDEFLSVMSHELRTPLNVIMGYVRLLKEKTFGELTDEQLHALTKVDKQSIELLALINAVMEATLLQSDAIVVERHLIDPLEFIESIQSQVAPPAEKLVDLIWHADATVQPVSIDRAKLERILMILIDNAIKFTTQGSIAISANFVSESGGVKFTVADTGIGIPTEFHDSIFEIFHQVDNSGTREYGGLGLGLFIAKQLAVRLGAELRVQSKVGQGSTFTLTVPLDNNLQDTRFTPEAVQQDRAV